jgi:hypothetical protein
MDPETPQESILLIHSKNGAATEITTLSLTPDQATALKRVGWSLFPHAPNQGMLQVAMAAIIITALHPGLIAQAIRGMNLTIDSTQLGKIRPAPPATKLEDQE